MNLIRKLKLKAMLRNCDYVLAGTVIKQQYYDESKNTEINRLIDQFMANPGFEEALKLIEYNEMMVFYFTESCEGGLYVRKGVQDAKKPAAKEPSASDPDGDTGRSRAEKVTPFFEAAAGGTTLSAGDAAAVPGSAEAAAADAASAETETGTGLSANETLTETQRKLKESEEWMEQMIERLSRKSNGSRVSTRYDWARERAQDQKSRDRFRDHADYRIAKENKAGSDAGDAAAEPETGSYASRLAEKPASPWDAEIPRPAGTTGTESETFPSADRTAEWTSSRSVDEHQPGLAEPEARAAKEEQRQESPAPADGDLEDLFRNAGADNAMRSLQAQADAAASGNTGNYDEDAVTETFDEPFSRTSVHRYDDSLEDTLVYNKERKEQPSEPSRAAEQRPDFSNVIATLKIDIHTMTQQIEEYRRQLTYYTPNEKQIRSWIRSLEAAIAEFSQAIDLLEGEK